MGRHRPAFFAEAGLARVRLHANPLIYGEGTRTYAGPGRVCSKDRPAECWNDHPT